MAKKTIFITGCSVGGIGDSLAQEFHRKGLRVFATARSVSKIAHLKEMGIDTLPLDVTSTTSIAEAASKVSAETGGKLDFLLNNSGGGYGMPVLDVTSTLRNRCTTSTSSRYHGDEGVHAAVDQSPWYGRQ